MHSFRYLVKLDHMSSQKPEPIEIKECILKSFYINDDDLTVKLLENGVPVKCIALRADQLQKSNEKLKIENEELTSIIAGHLKGCKEKCEKQIEVTNVALAEVARLRTENNKLKSKCDNQIEETNSALSEVARLEEINRLLKEKNLMEILDFKQALISMISNK